MNCAQCRENLIAYVEDVLDEPTADRVRSHLADCPACRADWEAARRLGDRLAGASGVAPEVSLEPRVMDEIIRRQGLELRRRKMRRRIRIVGFGSATAAAIAILLLFGWSTSPRRGVLEAAEVLAKGAEATPRVSTIHIRGEVRSLPRENFDHISPTLDLVPVEMWKDCGGRGKWRIEKPGRVIVMDGESTVMFIKPDMAVKAPPCERGFDTDFWHGLADVPDILAKELQTAIAKSNDMTLSHHKADDGTLKRIVTVEHKAGEADHDWGRTFSRSASRRTYRFDAESGRLEGMETHLHTDEGDVLIFRLAEIEYDRPIDPAVFRLDLPEGTNLMPLPGQVEKLADNERYEKMTPREAAQAFFQACADEDWDEFVKFFPGMATPRAKQILGGLEIIHIGEPQERPEGRGWLVPYEIKLRDGTVVTHKLGLSKPEAAKRFLIMGGL